MASQFEKILDKFSYDYPPELIANQPASPRDNSQLLVYNPQTGGSARAVFRDLGKYLPKRSVIVLNQTKVVPARLITYKKTGGKVEVLYLGRRGKNIEALTNKSVQIGEKLFLTEKIFFTVRERSENHLLLRSSFPVNKIFDVMLRYGQVPLPPYIKNTPLSQASLRQKYQTIFARDRGSVAAPTASLHFTNRLLKKLEKQGHRLVHVTLHVNLGTFASLRPDDLTRGKLHREWYEISKEAAGEIAAAKASGWPVIAVGTTALRALESAAQSENVIKAKNGETDLFIRPGYKFKIVDGLVTNFHVPKSSLLMLVAALIGREKLLGLYRQAISERFRLFSFGDAMLVLPKHVNTNAG